MRFPLKTITLLATCAALASCSGQAVTTEAKQPEPTPAVAVVPVVSEPVEVKQALTPTSAIMNSVPTTPAGFYHKEVLFRTNGMLAREAIALLDQGALYESLRPALCNVLGAYSVDQAKALMSDNFQKQGHDKLKADKMTNGLIVATTQPGACD